MTAAERDQVRALVAHTCHKQGVPLVVPPDVARDVAAMIAAGPRRRRRSPARPADVLTADQQRGRLMAVSAGAGGADASPAPK
jgi:tRNA A37 threonylcarbamoyltransferase TsaD